MSKLSIDIAVGICLAAAFIAISGAIFQGIVFPLAKFSWDKLSSKASLIPGMAVGGFFLLLTWLLVHNLS